MKVSITTKSGQPEMVINYSPDEWGKLKDKYETLGLVKDKTKKGLGSEAELNYMREKEKKLLLDHISLTTGIEKVIDDINKPAIHNNSVNIAVLRIIPNDSNAVVAPLNKLLNIKEAEDLMNNLTKALSATLSLVTEFETDIKFKESKISVKLGKCK